jgi:hypothetical protein
VRPDLVAAGAALAFLLAACTDLPGTINIAERDVNTDQLYVGTVEGIRGEPTAAVALYGVEGNMVCRGLTGVGGVSQVEPGMTGRLTLKCQDGRLIHGRIRYDALDRGSGLARDTKSADYQVMLGRFALRENDLRRQFAALPEPPRQPERRPSMAPTAPGPVEGDEAARPPAVPRERVEARPTPACTAPVIDGVCLDDFDLDEFEKDDLEQCLRAREQPTVKRDEIDA